METQHGAETIRDWPEESREAAQLVLDTYGEPNEITDSLLIWYGAGPWKRIIASKAFWTHDFPAPHFDSIETVLDYSVSTEQFTPLAEFDGSVIVERTAGEVSARCHDEQANSLALNLMHDIVTGAKTVQDARTYYAKEFADFRRKLPTPYMDKLHFQPGHNTPDADERLLSDDDLKHAEEEGKAKA